MRVSGTVPMNELTQKFTTYLWVQCTYLSKKSGNPGSGNCLMCGPSIHGHLFVYFKRNKVDFENPKVRNCHFSTKSVPD